MVTGISRFTKGEFSQDALDEVYNKGKELYKDPIAPPSSGIIINTVDLMVDDMYGDNTGWVSNMPSSYGQFPGPVRKDFHDKTFGKMLIWLEVEEAGTGSSCSQGISNSTNTAVEVGYIRSFKKENDVWSQHIALQNMNTNGTGSQYQVNGRWDGRYCHPTNGIVPGRNDKDRQDDLWDNPERRPSNFPFEPSIINPTTSSGYLSVAPARFYRFHGWTNSSFIDQSALQCYYGMAYIRLILIDPEGEDDRHLANFVCHISSDVRTDDNDYIGDIGMSRYRKVTNDWACINFFSGLSESEFRSNPPPIITIP